MVLAGWEGWGVGVGDTHITEPATSAEICVSPLYFLTFRVIPC